MHHLVTRFLRLSTLLMALSLSASALAAEPACYSDDPHFDHLDHYSVTLRGGIFYDTASSSFRLQLRSGEVVAIDPRGLTNGCEVLWLDSVKAVTANHPGQRIDASIYADRLPAIDGAGHLVLAPAVLTAAIAPGGFSTGNQ